MIGTDGTRTTGGGVLRTIVSEVAHSVDRIDDAQVSEALDLLRPGRSIHFAGAGRSGLVGRMAAMRLMHLGRTTHVVGDPTSPALREGDLLVAISGSGATESIVRIAAKAARLGAEVLAVTCAPESPLGATATRVLVIPAATKTDHTATTSIQYSGALFEQCLLVVTDGLFDRLWRESGQPAEELWTRHANLE